GAAPGAAGGAAPARHDGAQALQSRSWLELPVGVRLALLPAWDADAEEMVVVDAEALDALEPERAFEVGNEIVGAPRKPAEIERPEKPAPQSLAEDAVDEHEPVTRHARHLSETGEKGVVRQVM